MRTWDARTVAELIYNTERQFYYDNHLLLNLPPMARIIFNVADVNELRSTWQWANEFKSQVEIPEEYYEKGYVGTIAGLEVWANREHPINFITLTDDRFRAVLHVGRNSEAHEGGYCYGMGQCGRSLCTSSRPCNTCPRCVAKEKSREYYAKFKNPIDQGIIDIHKEYPLTMLAQAAKENPKPVPRAYTHGKTEVTAEQRREAMVRALINDQSHKKDTLK